MAEWNGIHLLLDGYFSGSFQDSFQVLFKGGTEILVDSVFVGLTERKCGLNGGVKPTERWRPFGDLFFFFGGGGNPFGILMGDAGGYGPGISANLRRSWADVLKPRETALIDASQ